MNNTTIKNIMLTPEMAKQLLETNDPRQRSINYAWAREIARDIENGRWDEGGDVDPIDINVNGYMQNGQHRCMAVIMAKKAVPSMIRYNCPEEWFYKYDRNKARSVRDYYNGKNKTIIIPLAKFAICYEERSSLKNALKGRIRSYGIEHSKTSYREVATTQEIYEYITENNESMAYYASLGKRISTDLKGGSPTAFACALWTISKFSVNPNFIKNMVDDFCGNPPINNNLTVIKLWAQKEITKYSRERVNPSKEWSFSLVMACYESYLTDVGIKSPKKFILKTLNKYDEIFKERSLYNE